MSSGGRPAISEARQHPTQTVSRKSAALRPRGDNRGVINEYYLTGELKRTWQARRILVGCDGLVVFQARRLGVERASKCYELF